MWTTVKTFKLALLRHTTETETNHEWDEESYVRLAEMRVLRGI